MHDLEFIQMRNRFLLALVITIIFIIPVCILVINKFSSKSLLLKNIEKQKNLVIFLTNKECSNCELYKDVLDQNNVPYFELDVDTDTDFKEIMFRIQMASEYAQAPGIIYVEEGKMFANMVDIKEKSELESFIVAHSLINTKKESD